MSTFSFRFGLFFGLPSAFAGRPTSSFSHAVNMDELPLIAEAKVNGPALPVLDLLSHL